MLNVDVNPSLPRLAPVFSDFLGFFGEREIDRLRLVSREVLQLTDTHRGYRVIRDYHDFSLLIPFMLSAERTEWFRASLARSTLKMNFFGDLDYEQIMAFGDRTKKFMNLFSKLDVIFGSYPTRPLLLSFCKLLANYNYAVTFSPVAKIEILEEYSMICRHLRIPLADEVSMFVRLDMLDHVSRALIHFADVKKFSYHCFDELEFDHIADLVNFFRQRREKGLESSFEFPHLENILPECVPQIAPYVTKVDTFDISDRENMQEQFDLCNSLPVEKITFRSSKFDINFLESISTDQNIKIYRFITEGLQVNFEMSDVAISRVANCREVILNIRPSAQKLDFAFLSNFPKLHSLEIYIHSIADDLTSIKLPHVMGLKELKITCPHSCTLEEPVLLCHHSLVEKSPSYLSATRTTVLRPSTWSDSQVRSHLRNKFPGFIPKKEYIYFPGKGLNKYSSKLCEIHFKSADDTYDEGM